MKPIQVIKITPAQANIELDLSIGSIFEILLNRNIVLSFIQHQYAQKYKIIFRQDNTGGRTVAFNNISVEAATDPDSISILEFMSVDNSIFLYSPFQYASIPSAKFSIREISDVEAVLNILASEVCTVYWAVFESAAEAPTKEVIVAGTGATDYGSKALASQTNTTDDIVGLDPNTSYKLYFYLVDAEDNESAIYTSDAFITLLETPVIAALADGTDTINVTWTNVTGNEGYEIEISDDGETWGDPVLIAQDAEIYSLEGLEPETTKYFRLKALGDGIDTFNSPYSNEANDTTDAE